MLAGKLLTVLSGLTKGLSMLAGLTERLIWLPSLAGVLGLLARELLWPMGGALRCAHGAPCSWNYVGLGR